MRMSDWRSDVCSSDLFDQRTAGRIVRVRREAHVRDHRRRVAAPGLFQCPQHPRDTGTRQEPVVNGAQGEVDVDRHVDVELARASCRERVCQYVLLQVAAVSLKKKKIIIKETYS